MTRTIAYEAATASSRVGLWWMAVGIGLTALYTLVFVITGYHGPVVDAVVWALCNAAPHVLLAIPLVDRLGPRLLRTRLNRAVGVAVLTSLVYAAVAYGATIFLLALTSRIETDGLFVRFFQGPAVVWQSFQALAYAALALTAGMLIDARRAMAPLSAARSTPPACRNWLVRTPDGIVPIDPRELIRVEAEGDYVRIVLPQRTILSRIGLGDCAERLVDLPFLRVHRSHLVNSDAIVRAEPAGNGRIQLQLKNGDQVITSRDGARLVRSASI
ncbi:LytTR family transcriptional regulator [Brevundimonas sp. BT-123]|uniref:LytTR family DNA-binding domain-containing protein n=1 Tax=Brevundimonas sp. BT-123 TaxID=2986928 RepID=UPI002236795E|nr:LytTR family DNA-binding domain-containing protein [Brevundimonas sp. BT-123]MCW0047678.1 LytTR family transcriptional regulator [Brevundimonas sp. BT-123]